MSTDNFQDQITVRASSTAQALGPNPSDPLTRFAENARKFFQMLRQHHGDLNSQAATTLASSIQEMLANFVAAYNEMRLETQKSKQTILALKDSSISPTDHQATACTQTEHLRRELRTVKSTLRETCGLHLQTVHDSVLQYRERELHPALNQITKSIQDDEQKRLKLIAKQDRIRCIEPPKPGDKWSALICFIITPFVNHGVRGGIKKLENRVLELQESIDAKRHEEENLTALEQQSTAALDLAETCMQQWKDTIKWIADPMRSFLLDLSPDCITPLQSENTANYLTGLLETIHALDVQLNSAVLTGAPSFEEEEMRAINDPLREFQQELSHVSGIFTSLLSLANNAVQERHQEHIRNLIQELIKKYIPQVQSARGVLVEWTSYVRVSSTSSVQCLPDKLRDKANDLCLTSPLFRDNVRNDTCRLSKEILVRFSPKKSKEFAQKNGSLPLALHDVRELIAKLEKLNEVIVNFALDVGLGLCRNDSSARDSSPVTRRSNAPTRGLNPFLVNLDLLDATRKMVVTELARLNVLSI